MVDVSICMVSLSCWKVVKDCLESLRSSQTDFTYEVIVVDNGSWDGTAEQIEAHFPEVRLIRNDRNIGFTKATNQAIGYSSGEYIVWLNTDTILGRDSIEKMYDFMKGNIRVGIVGPKVLNADGSFQPQCKRGVPTPAAVLFYMLKLDQLWPDKPAVGGYLLSYLPVDRATEVDCVSGCCLMARRRVWEEIGGLDENIFGFGEDIDWCIRAKQAGWEVWYFPQSVITHLKGQGGVHVRPYHKVWGMHQAMRVFYRKHLMSQYPWFVTVLVWVGVWSSFVISSIGALLRQTARIWGDRWA